MKKEGFVSMAVVYTFIIVFVLIIVSLLSLYSFRYKITTGLVDEVKKELNKEYN